MTAQTETSQTHTALVLSGGGVAGIAWELGVLVGIADVEPELAASILAADVVVGTSAGSSVGAQITSGTELADLYARQLDTSSDEISVDVDLMQLVADFQAATADATSAAEVRQRICDLALSADTVSESSRRDVIASRLPRHEWPDRDLKVIAVDATNGERAVFTRDSGVGLVDAVSASCAVPGVWPPITVAGTRYVDGGVWSGSNADLAVGADRVLVLSPTLPDGPVVLGRSLTDEVTELSGARVHVIYADDASVAAFGMNPLAISTRRPSALAGREVGRASAAAVAVLWADRA